MFQLTAPFLTAYWPTLFALAGLALAARPMGSSPAPMRVRTDTIHRRVP
jgi:hypothetical protein